MSTHQTSIDLDHLLNRSDELENELAEFLSSLTIGTDAKTQATVAMSSIAFEHAASLRMLLGTGLATSAMSLLRLQYDAIVKQAWVLYAASDLEVSKILNPLSPEAEQKEKNSQVGTNAMLVELEKKAPPPLYRQLNEFKTYSGKPLNSFVHSGIHAVNRKAEGFPIALLLQAVRNSNNLLSMSAMGLTVLLNDFGLSLHVRDISKKYAECLQLDPSKQF